MFYFKVYEDYFSSHKLQCTSWLFKPKKISTKLSVDLYSKAKIQTFTTVITQWNSIPNN